MGFQRQFVRQDQIQRAVEAVLVDLLIVELEQITKRRAPKPICGNV